MRPPPHLRVRSGPIPTQTRASAPGGLRALAHKQPVHLGTQQGGLARIGPRLPRGCRLQSLASWLLALASRSEPRLRVRWGKRTGEPSAAGAHGGGPRQWVPCSAQSFEGQLNIAGRAAIVWARSLLSRRIVPLSGTSEHSTAATAQPLVHGRWCRSAAVSACSGDCDEGGRRGRFLALRCLSATSL